MVRPIQNTGRWDLWSLFQESWGREGVGVIRERRLVGWLKACFNNLNVVRLPALLPVSGYLLSLFKFFVPRMRECAHAHGPNAAAAATAQIVFLCCVFSYIFMWSPLRHFANVAIVVAVVVV